MPVTRCQIARVETFKRYGFVNYRVITRGVDEPRRLSCSRMLVAALCERAAQGGQELDLTWTKRFGCELEHASLVQPEVAA